MDCDFFMQNPFEFDLILILSGYLIAIFSRFRILIVLLQTVVMAVKVYQLIANHKVEIDEHIQRYIKRVEHVEKLIFPVVFGPIQNLFKKKDPVMEVETIPIQEQAI